MKKMNNLKSNVRGVIMTEKSIEEKKQALISLIEAFFDKNFIENINDKEKKSVSKNKKAN